MALADRAVRCALHRPSPSSGAQLAKHMPCASHKWRLLTESGQAMADREEMETRADRHPSFYLCVCKFPTEIMRISLGQPFAWFLVCSWAREPPPGAHL